MTGTRKLGRTTAQRNAMLRGLVTALFQSGRIKTTEARAKEARVIAEKLITIAIKERDNVTSATKWVSRPKLDSKGRKITTTVTSKNGKKYLKVEREKVQEMVTLDAPSKLAARRQIMSYVYKVKDADGKNIDLPKKLFEDMALKYKDRNGGYTRILKLGPRRGDGAEEVILELV
ncbi:MAG: 50S ribosomal protein L17 [Ignavibacteriales bacterium]